MDDGREGLSEIDRALADALDVDVSPDFASRVRQRIAVEPRPAPFWRDWRIVLPAAAAALVVVAAGVTMIAKRPPSTPRLLAARSVSVPQPRPADVGPAGPVLAVNGPAPVKRSRVASVSAPAPSEPEVLVPHEEVEMYRRLIAAAQGVRGAVLVDAPMDIVADRVISDIVIDPIKIELIVPPVGGEGDRK